MLKLFAAPLLLGLALAAPAAAGEAQDRLFAVGVLDAVPTGGRLVFAHERAGSFDAARLPKIEDGAIELAVVADENGGREAELTLASDGPKSGRSGGCRPAPGIRSCSSSSRPPRATSRCLPAAARSTSATACARRWARRTVPSRWCWTGQARRASFSASARSRTTATATGSGRSPGSRSA